jgi:hypothetical protein
MEEKYKNKYLKYKNKYLQLKNLSGGGNKRIKLGDGEYIKSTNTFLNLLQLFKEKLKIEYERIMQQFFITDSELCDNNCNDLFNMIINWLFGSEKITIMKKKFDIEKDIYIIDYMNICKIITTNLSINFNPIMNIDIILFNFIVNKLLKGNYIIISYKGGCDLNVDSLLSFQNSFLKRYLNNNLFIYSYTLFANTVAIKSNIDDFIFWIFVIYFYTIYENKLDNLYIITNDKQYINTSDKIIFNQNNINDRLNQLIIYNNGANSIINNDDLTLFKTLQDILQKNYNFVNQESIFENINGELNNDTLNLSELFLMLIKKIQFDIYKNLNGSIDQPIINNILIYPNFKFYISFNNNKITWNSIYLEP